MHRLSVACHTSTAACMCGRDARPGRTEWLASTAAERRPPMSKKRNLMKNPEKLAASKKKPVVAEYVIGNRIRYMRGE